MSSNRIQRINEDIRGALSRLLREVKDPRIHQGMLSVVAVDTTSDLKYCKVYLSVLGLEDEARLMKGLDSAMGFLRRELGNRLSIRHTPELTFRLDKSMEHGAHVSTILRNLEEADADDATDSEPEQ